VPRKKTDIKKFCVSIHTYKGYLVISGPVDLKHKDWVPAGDGKIGCVLLHSGKHLEISETALKVLRKVRKCRDAIGDFMWWGSNNDGWCFAWLGGPRNLKKIELIENGALVGDKDFQVPGSKHYVLVENSPPQEACEAVDADLGQ
jgi:hypothetical protein